MRAALLLLVVLAAGVAVAGVRAWRGAGESARAELEQRGRGMAESLVATVVSARVRGHDAEQRERLRLGAVARRLRSDLTRPLGPAVDRLTEAAHEEQLGRVFLFDKRGARVARVARGTLPAFLREGEEGPPPGEDAEWAQAAATAQPLLDGSLALVEERLAPNVFGTTFRITLGVRTEDGGALLVASDASDLEALQRGGDLESALAEACLQPDVLDAVLTSAGRTLARAQARGGPAADGARRTFAQRWDDAGGEGSFEVALALSTARVDELVARERRAIALWAGLGAAAALAAAFLLWRTERAARRRREQEEAQRREQQRLAQMGVLAGLFVHELSNPLNALALQLSALERETGATGAAGVARVKQALGRARASLESFLSVAAPLEPRPGEGYGVAQLEATLAELSAERGLALPLRVAPAAAARRVAARATVLDQALRNLLRNALEATPAGRAVEVAWDASADGGVCVTVRDEGPGFPAALLTQGPVLGGTDRQGGHGLGLYLARRIVEGLGGRLALENPPAGGAVAAATLPAAPEEGA